LSLYRFRTWVTLSNPEKEQKKTPEERFEVRHSIWRAMPLLLAKGGLSLEENLIVINHIAVLV